MWWRLLPPPGWSKVKIRSFFRLIFPLQVTYFAAEKTTISWAKRSPFAHLLGRFSNFPRVSSSLMAMWSLQRPVCQGRGVYLWCFWMSQDSWEGQLRHSFQVVISSVESLHLNTWKDESSKNMVFVSRPITSRRNCWFYVSWGVLWVKKKHLLLLGATLGFSTQILSRPCFPFKNFWPSKSKRASSWCCCHSISIIKTQDPSAEPELNRIDLPSPQNLQTR